jgi:regulator of protease activity HflC (stomatin/prohibitin superfamily)
MLQLLALLAGAVILLWIVFTALRLRHVVVFEYQKALLYKKGRYVRTLDAGSYWIRSSSSMIVAVDIRPEFITIQGQDVLSADGVALKISLAAEFQVTDPNLAVNKNQNFRGSLYLTLQMALREIVGKEKVDTLLENRAGIGGKLMELASGKASEMGVKLMSADVKDMMLSGDMKKAFSQVVKAQKEGQAALEKARGETAALRSLANAARLMDDNPNLLHLRALQTLEDSSGNTLVVGLSGGVLPVAKSTEKTVKNIPKKEGDE